MDHIAVKEYVLVYFHTLTSEYNHLDSDFLKKLYDVVDVKLVIFSNYEGGKQPFSFRVLSNSKHRCVFCERIVHVTKIFILLRLDILIIGPP